VCAFAGETPALGGDIVQYTPGLRRPTEPIAVAHLPAASFHVPSRPDHRALPRVYYSPKRAMSTSAEAGTANARGSLLVLSASMESLTRPKPRGSP
jgi:hypothetical protein